MGLKIENIVECYSCGLFIEKNLEKNIKSKCPRCNSKLNLEKEYSFDSLYYSISALLLFILLNIYPIMSLTFAENQLKSTFISSVLILYKQDFFFVATIVLFTLVIAPILSSFIIIFSFLQIHTKLQFFNKTFLYDSFSFFRTWGFIEVFVISIIVTYIKLVGMVSNTRFDIGFYILLCYLFCFYMANIKFEAKKILGE